MATATLLACDWGTTNLRAWTLADDGEVVASRDFPFGVARLAAGEAPARFAQVRKALGAREFPAMLCGMVGSNLGWTLAPYVDCPTGFPEIAAGLVDVGDRVRIVPGVRAAGFNGQGDVMRGEETQLFGWLAAEPARAVGRRLICHPGTHAKWMAVDDGRLTAFVTAMTGELFGLLTAHGVLKTDAPADDMAAFDEGVAAAGEGDALAARLFTARARVVGKGKPAESTASYLSGLLIGADVAATSRLLDAGERDPVVLLGDVGLCGLYARALAARGVACEIHDGEAAVRAGLLALWKAVA
ncbi:2-dehydro-3-deoxygalactonokinase [Phenylobacterium sp.]|uniref:2-dehydro-3-deoxygalactonokinase n=1 Tax=Phenylobacterium sp. TaxID=1871053 RepID=UPI0025E5CA66|nr:2-dehydro-3-deoxygalactonokinase [Phenylobacterium sp.]